MLAKLTDKTQGKTWYKVLEQVEYAINNTVNKSTGLNPSQIVFRLDQRGLCVDHFQNLITDDNINNTRDLQAIRDKAKKNIKYSRICQETSYNKKHKASHEYRKSELVMIKNFESTSGTSRKLIRRFRGPYEIKKILGNDHYLMSDLPGFKNTQKIYEGIWEAKNIRRWI